jgi:hypothetical protein
MEDRRSVRLVWHPTAVVRPLARGTAVVMLAGVVALILRTRLGHDSVFGLVPMFDLDREHDIPAFCSTLLLLAAALGFAGVAAVHRAEGSRLAGGWTALALGFLVMATDENLALHEEFIDPLRQMLGEGPGGAFHFAWVLVAAPLVLLLGLAFWRWLGALDAPTRRGLLRAAAVYLAGALGVEVLGGMWASRHGVLGLGYGLIVALEEGLEMAGSIMALHAALQHAARRYGAVTVERSPHRG